MVSYAASAGALARFKETFCEFEPVLREYDALSVREEEVQGFLEEKLQRKVHTVLDPTLLIDRQLWMQLIEAVLIEVTIIWFIMMSHRIAYLEKLQRLLQITISILL